MDTSIHNFLMVIQNQEPERITTVSELQAQYDCIKSIDCKNEPLQCQSVIREVVAEKLLAT